MNYLGWLEKLKVIPNFWCAEEYFEKAGLEEELRPDGFLIVKDNQTVMFPAIDTEFGAIGTGGVPRIWSDFVTGYAGWGVKDYSPSFLDYEYLYDPKEFSTMEGGKWQVFRKNCRKFPHRHNSILTYTRMGAWPYPGLDAAFTSMFQEWLSGVDREIQDDEVMLKYFSEGFNRKILWSHTEKKIYGINIWDENYQYINFRYSFCRKGDFLPEYMRWLFYRDGEILHKGKLVNDGGVLDNPNLEKFKNKMNPYKIRKVYSWVKNIS